MIVVFVSVGPIPTGEMLLYMATCEAKCEQALSTHLPAEAGSRDLADEGL